MHIHNQDWVVVCDGRKALILENTGDAELINLVIRETYDEPAPSTAEMGTERPCRVHQRVGHGRSAVEQTDWHAEAEEAFLRKLAERLDKAVAGGDVKAIVLVAAPKALGTLRGVLSAPVERALRAHLAKDYVNQPVSEIEKHLKASP